MRYLNLSLYFNLFSLATFCQYNLPQSWDSLEVTTIDKTDTTYLETFYLPGTVKDTVTITVRMELTIAKNGLIKEYDVYKTFVTAMEDNKINSETVKLYEEKVRRFYEYLMSERVIYEKPRNREFKMMENKSFYVAGKDVYL